LTIGLNAVDPRHYGGWSGKLTACEADAEDMAAIATSRGFGVTTLMTKAATRQRVKTEISRAAESLEPRDIFMLNYSGHGGQLPDRNSDEPDAQDEMWCLYDAQLVDDELYALFESFARGCPDPGLLGQLPQRLGRQTGLLRGHRPGTYRSLQRPRCVLPQHAPGAGAQDVPRQQGFLRRDT